MSKSSTSKWLYLQVLVAVVVGAALGHFAQDLAKQMMPVGDGFVKLVRMLIAPIIFFTVVVSIGKLSNSASVGRIGLKAILYFEVLTTFAMVIGLAVGHFVVWWEDTLERARAVLNGQDVPDLEEATA